MTALTTTDKLRNRIQLLADVVDDLGRTLDRVEQEHKEELVALRAEIAAMQGYREEQIARAIAQHETDALAERLSMAKRRRAIVCSPGNAL